jgi:hypothetical protein
MRRKPAGQAARLGLGDVDDLVQAAEERLEQVAQLGAEDEADGDGDRSQDGVLDEGDARGSGGTPEATFTPGAGQMGWPEVTTDRRQLPLAGVMEVSRGGGSVPPPTPSSRAATPLLDNLRRAVAGGLL